MSGSARACMLLHHVLARSNYSVYKYGMGQSEFILQGTAPDTDKDPTQQHQHQLRKLPCPLFV